MLCYEVVEKKVLTVDLSSVKEVPAEEAEVEIKDISFFYNSERVGNIYLPRCIVEKKLPVWRWKGKLWIEVMEVKCSQLSTIQAKIQ